MARSTAVTQREQLTRNVENGAITERDAELLRSYLDWAEAEKAETTVGNHAFYLRKLAERMDTPLSESTIEDLLRNLEQMKTGAHPDVKDDGIVVGNYQATLRVFYRYHDQLGIDPDDIEIDRNQGRELTPSDLLYQDDVDALLHACFENARDRAFIALALATGQRLDAIRTLRLKHIKRNGRTMEMQLNQDEGALKGASGTKPLLWAKHYVRTWVDNHPFKGDPESAVFCATDKSVLNREDVEPAEPMHPSAFRRILDNRAAKANLDKDVYPHLLRHTAITRMVTEGLSEQSIKQIAGWSGDSSEFDTYVTLADELNNDSIRKQLGYPDSGNDVIIGKPTLDQCPECGDRLPGEADHCLTCQTPLSYAAAEADSSETADEDTRRHYREADDMETVEKLQMLDELLDDPEVRQLLEQRMGNDG